MKKYLITILAVTGFFCAKSQTVLGSGNGNYASPGAENYSTGIIDLNNPPGSTWGTYRLSPQGYFSAAQGGGYINYSDAENVDGYVKVYDTTSFVFPVGTGTDLRLVSISNAPAIDTIATAYIIGSPNTNADPTDPTGMQLHSTFSLGAGILGVSGIGYWDWQDFGNNAAGTTVSVSIPDLSALNPQPLPGDLRLVGWNGSMWINLSATQGNTAASGIIENSTLTGTMQNGITAIGIGSVSSTLFITLVDFTGAPKGQGVLLSWTTSTEGNNKGFDVQRSTDGVSYHSIGFVNSAAPDGNSDAKLSYSFMDNNPANGANYYRLNQTDLDGQGTLTKIITVVFQESNFHLKATPNPATSYLQVSGVEPGSKFQVVNMVGQVVIPYTTDKTIAVDRIARGSYVLQVLAQNGQLQSYIFVKQ